MSPSLEDLGVTEDDLAELDMSRAEVEEILTPIAIGPTWGRNEDGSWLLPEHTLGWQIAGWCAKYVRGANGGRWTFTPEQLRFLLWWYSVDDKGDWTYYSGVLQRLKGWGKDPLLAVISLVEFVGPCRFAGWAENGEPIAEPVRDPLVQIAAVDKDQTKSTMLAIQAYITDELKAAHSIEVLEEMLRAPGGKILKCVTSNYRSLEGGRTSFFVLNETHHWVAANRGIKMYETMSGNVTKMAGAATKRARWLCITNAYVPNEDSVAQRLREDYEATLETGVDDIGMLYDSLEADPRVPLQGPLLKPALRVIRGDATWLDPDVIALTIARKSSISPSRSRRMWLNQIVADGDALHGPETWDPIAQPDAQLRPGDRIVLGFDGGKSRDATALVAIRAKDRCAFLLHLQERPDAKEGEDWTVNRRAVESAVHEAFRLYDVAGFYADVAQWESHTAAWNEQYGENLDVRVAERNAIEWDMRRSVEKNTHAHERLMAAVFDGERLSHDGDRRLRRHVLNAVRRPNQYGLYFDAESKDSMRKVDAYAALMLAHEALLALGAKKTKKPTGNSDGWFF